MERIEDALARFSERARKKIGQGHKSACVKSATLAETPINRAQTEDKEFSDNCEVVEQQSQDSLQADIAVLVALPSPELDQVLRTLAPQWRKEGREGVVFNVAQAEIHGENLTIAVAVQNDMGMVPAAILATKTIRAWRPRLLAMAGICAGVKGKVNLGDIVVGKQLFDYGSGKLKNGRLQPDYQPVSMDDQLCNCAIHLASDKPTLSTIRADWPLATGKPDTDLHAHVGSMASGAAVVADDSVVEGIQQHKRSLIAVDMESYGFARAASSSLSPTPFIVVKGVQDFANESKADDFREYAAFVSANYLYRFLNTYWGDIRQKDV